MSFELPKDFDPKKPWIGKVPITTVMPNPDQPRKEFDPEEMERMAKSEEDMQIQPILVIPHKELGRPEILWMIVDGERRWRGHQMNETTEILICYQPGVTRENLHSKSFAANFCRVGHNHAETARAIDREYSAGKTYEQIARMVGKTSGWASNEHSLLKLEPSLLKLVDLRENRMAFKVAMVLAALPHDKQLVQWRRVKHLSAKAQFTKLRFSKDVRNVVDSRRRDDRFCTRYGESLIRAAYSLADIPRAMLRELKPETVQELYAMLDKTDEHIARIRERLANAKNGGA